MKLLFSILALSTVFSLFSCGNKETGVKVNSSSNEKNLMDYYFPKTDEVKVYKYVTKLSGHMNSTGVEYRLYSFNDNGSLKMKSFVDGKNPLWESECNISDSDVKVVSFSYLMTGESNKAVIEESTIYSNDKENEYGSKYKVQFGSAMRVVGSRRKFSKFGTLAIQDSIYRVAEFDDKMYYPEEKDTVSMTSYFAKDIGLVKILAINGRDTSSMELEKVLTEKEFEALK